MVHESKTTRIHNANDKPLPILGGIKLHVRVGRITEVVNFPVCERLAVSVIFDSDFCDQALECFYQKPSTEEVIDASTVPIVQHFGKQRSTVIKNTKNVRFSKRNGRVYPKTRSMELVRIPPFSQNRNHCTNGTRSVESRYFRNAHRESYGM